MSNDLAPAGWYPNPDGTDSLRWWSGVGWTEYTREAPETQEPAALQPPEEAWDRETAQPATTWGQPVEPVAPTAGYAPYAPRTAAPLTPSRMRPLNAMFADIGRIARRAWWPILGISMVIWGLVAVVYLAAVLAFVDLGALERGFDLLADQTSNGTGELVIEGEIATSFGEAFAALSPSGWAILGAALTLLLLMASTIQIAAVNRLGMDAAAGLPVTWATGWKSGFTAGFRLFGYYLLLVVLFGALWIAASALVVGLFAVSPALGGLAGLMAFAVVTVVSIWAFGRLIPIACQAVVDSHALQWSWASTKGRFWAVMGRYILWAIAASIIANVVVTIVSIPLSFLVIGSAATSGASGEMGASLVLTLITLPVSLALTAVTLIGVVPIWRDLTDHPAYRSIDEQGIPIEVPTHTESA